MDPCEFLDLASELATGSRQGDWRTAASRAYYAAFHVARRVLQQAGFLVPTAERAHAYLWLRLANAGNAVVQQAGHWLHDLRRIRNEADYDLDRWFAHEAAVDNVDKAIDAIRILEDLEGEPVILSQVTGAIRTYERDVLHDVTWHGPDRSSGAT